MQIAFGALVDSIHKQLKKQKFKFDKEEIKHFQRLADQMLYLSFHGILTEGAYNKARNRFMKKLGSHINKHNKHVNKTN